MNMDHTNICLAACALQIHAVSGSTLIHQNGEM